jgi:hypothetical protein
MSTAKSMPLWMYLCKKENIVNTPTTKSSVMPDAPIKNNIKPIYETTNVAKKLFSNVVKDQDKPEVKAQDKPEVKAQVKPEVKAQVKPEVKAQENSDEETNDNTLTNTKTDYFTTNPFKTQISVAENVNEEIKCRVTNCTETFFPIKQEKRCAECREHNTEHIEPCIVDGCDEMVYMTHQQVKNGMSKYGDKFAYHNRCTTHFKKKTYKNNSEACSVSSDNDMNPIVYISNCKKDDCENKIELTQSQFDFFHQDHMEMPNFCEPCRKERKVAKQVVKHFCSACNDSIEISNMMVESIESKGHLVTCGPCRNTNTRNCKICKKSFFSLAQEAELKAKYKKNFKPPTCCSKKCADQKT